MKLFSPATYRGVDLKNRIIVPPMMTYRSNPEALVTDWHLAHYGKLAIGGAAMVIVEGTAVSEEGRSGYFDLGIYSDDQIEHLSRLAKLIKDVDCVPAIQLIHSGRKGSYRRPWHGYSPLTQEDVELRGEHPVPTYAPSPIPLAEDGPIPIEIPLEMIPDIVEEWAEAARRADQAGFEFLEIHGAHGYLLHEFLSPISNHRTDKYGGELENRMRLLLEVTAAVRKAWPANKPLSVRVSSVDGVEGGWNMDDTVALSRELKALEVDLVHCTSGGLGGSATATRLPRGPGFQVPFAEQVMREVGIPTIAVGLITEPEQANEILEEGKAALVAVGREALLSPNWPNIARTKLQPERGYSDWNEEAGWWLDKRAASIAPSVNRN